MLKLKGIVGICTLQARPRSVTPQIPSAYHSCLGVAFTLLSCYSWLVPIQELLLAPRCRARLRVTERVTGLNPASGGFLDPPSPPKSPPRCWVAMVGHCGSALFRVACTATNLTGQLMEPFHTPYGLDLAFNSWILLVPFARPFSLQAGPCSQR